MGDLKCVCEVRGIQISSKVVEEKFDEEEDPRV